MRKHILLTACLWAITIAAHAQWQRMSGPGHYLVSGFTKYGGREYASSLEVMFTRPVGTDDWQSLTAVPDTFNPGVFFQIGSTLFSHSILGLYRSGNGNTWDDITPRSGRLIWYQAEDSLIFGIERFQIPNSKVYRSADSGYTWDTVLVTGNIQQFYFLGKVGPSYYLWVQVSGNNPVKIFKSDDTGKTWMDAGTLPAGTGTDAVQIGDTLFASNTAAPGVKISPDGGLTWLPLDNGLPAQLQGGYLFRKGNSAFLMSQYQGQRVLYHITTSDAAWVLAAATPPDHYKALATDSAIYLMADFNQLYRSTDDGQSWSQVNFPVAKDFLPNYAWQSGNRVVLYGEGGLYSSADNGLNWKRDRNGMTPHELTIDQMTVQNNQIVAGCSPGLLRSADQGATWTLLQNGIPRLPYFFTYQRQVLIAPNTMLLATPEGIFRSTDNGADWQQTGFKTSFPLETPWILTRQGGAVFLCASSEKIFRSDDDGLSWHYVSILPGTPAHTLYFLLASGDTLICGGITTYFTSTNGGVSWAPHAYTGLTGLSVWNMTLDAGKYYVGGFANNNPFIGMSEDLINWKKITVDSTGPGRQCYAILAKDNMLIAPFADRGIYLSKDYGDTWLRMPGSDEPKLNVIYTMAMDNDYVYAGSAFYGVWRYPLWNIIDAVKNAGPAAVHALTLYPNPAQRQASLQYSLEQAARVRVVLYDLSGKELAVLAQGRRESGLVQEQIEFPPGLSPGQYRVSVSVLQRVASIPVMLR